MGKIEKDRINLWECGCWIIDFNDKFIEYKMDDIMKLNRRYIKLWKERR